MNAPAILAALGGLATVLSLLGGIGLWALRLVIREELRPFRHELRDVQAQVAALNDAVFERPHGRGASV